MKMKKFKKAMKNFKKVRLSLGMKIIALLSCVALLSMGFASWWVIKTDTGTTMGSFVTYAVEEKNVRIDGFTGVSTDGKNSHPDIVFGAPAVSNSGWLQAHEKPANENLTFTYTYDLWSEDGDVRQFVNSVVLTLTPNANIVANLEKAIERGYITNPKVSCKIGESGSVVEGTYDPETDKIEVSLPVTNQSAVVTATKNEESITTVVRVSVTVTFAWGAAFKLEDGEAGINPYNYFNALTSTAAPENTYAKKYNSNGDSTPCATNADYALAALADVNALLGTTQANGAYTITYVPTIASQS